MFLECHGDLLADWRSIVRSSASAAAIARQQRFLKIPLAEARRFRPVPPMGLAGLAAIAVSWRS
jgi:hypothetical protein